SRGCGQQRLVFRYQLGAWGTMFFFSSRRRHTRLVSDWSSDVCSSDLVSATALRFFFSVTLKKNRRAVALTLAVPTDVPIEASHRSEERRVGKERRSRGSAYD